MTWCDKLDSTPTVGIKLDWYFTSGNKLLDCLSPIISDLHTDDAPAFSIEKQEAFGIVFTTNDGFQYSASSNALAISFVHRAKVRYGGGGTPIMELMSTAKPYSEVLQIACKKLAKAAALLPNSSGRHIERIGIVSNTLVEEDDFPPGIAKLVKYFGRPWAGPLESYTFQALAEIGTASDWVDKCIHSVTKSTNKESLPVLNFDWQRTFEKGRAFSEKSLNGELMTARDSALSYFETLAEGSMFDEDVISKNGT